MSEGNEKASQTEVLPPGWAATTLNELAPEFQNGLSKRVGNKGEPISVLRLADINDHQIDLKNTRKILLTEDEIQKYSVKNNDFLIVRVNGSTKIVGRLILSSGNEDQISYCDHFIRMRLPKLFVEPRFIKHTGKSFEFRRQIELNFVTTAGQKTINQGHISGISLALPPLAEQIRIADTLDNLLARVDVGRERLERVPKLLKRFRQSVLSAAVSGELTREWRGGGDAKWEKATGYDVFSFVTSGSRGWAEYYSDSGSIFIRIGNLEHHNIALDLRNIQYVKPPRGVEGLRTRVQIDDILISITADVGMVAHIDQDVGEAYINQHICMARPNSENNARYLAYFLTAPNGGLAHLKNIQRGATKVGLTLGDIRGTVFQLPPLAEQAEIVRRVEALFSIADRIEAKYAAALSSFDRLTPALLAKAFRGELVPQDPNDEPASVLLERIQAQRAAAPGKAKRGRPAKAATESAPEGEAAPARRRGRPRKAEAATTKPADAGDIPQAGSFDDAVRLLEERKLAGRQ